MKNITHSIRNIIKGVIVFFLFFYSFLWQYIPLIAFKIDTEILTSNIRLAVLFSTFSDAILLLLLLLIYRKDLLEEWKKFKDKFLYNIGTGLIYWILGIFIMFTANIVLFIVFKSSASNNEQLVRSFVTSFPLIMGVNVCIVAPIVEEIVFRKTLKDIFKNRFVFAAVSFLLFGGAHVVRQATSLVDWLYIIPYGVMGFVFALADYKTDTVCTSMFTHILHNTLSLIMILFL